MIGVKINAAKSMFFDRVVISAVNRAEIKTLSKMGAFIRTSARSSIRKRKAASKPGSPPTNRTGLLKKFIFFGYDSGSNSVVAGPALLNAKSRGKAPGVLEFGGDITLPAGPKRKKPQTVEIEARPYMGPALVANSPKFPSLWANTVKP